MYNECDSQTSWHRITLGGFYVKIYLTKIIVDRIIAEVTRNDYRPQRPHNRLFTLSKGDKISWKEPFQIKEQYSTFSFKMLVYIIPFFNIFESSAFSPQRWINYKYFLQNIPWVFWRWVVIRRVDWTIDRILLVACIIIATFQSIH